MALESLRARVGPWLRSRNVQVGALVFVGVALFLCSTACQTPTDQDEGYFALSFELVAKGKVLYRDFFYPQAPLLPYLMGAVWMVLHPTMTALRCIMALVTAGTAALIASRTYKDTASWAAAFATGVFIACHELGWQWLTAVKAYGVAVLLLTSALLIVTARTRPSRTMLVLAGVLAAGACSTRLLVAPAIPMVIMAASTRHVRGQVLRGSVAALACLFAIFSSSNVSMAACVAVAGAALLVTRSWRPVVVDGALVVAGCVVGSLPAVALYVLAPKGFVFGNVGYHALRGGASTLFGAWEENRPTFHAILGIHELSEFSATGVQFSILIALSILSIASAPNPFRRLPFLCTSLLCAAADLRPNGVHEQYFSTSIAGLALCAAGFLGDTVSRRGFRQSMSIGALALYYASLARASFNRKVDEGMFGPWDMVAGRPVYTDGTARQVHDAEASLPGPILTSWPGHALGSAEHVMSGYENQFSRWVADRVPSADRAVIHLKTQGDFLRDLASGHATVLVLGRELDHSGGDASRTLALACGYQVFEEPIRGMTVYVRRGAPTAECH